MGEAAATLTRRKNMPIAGKGMLITSMDVDPADEAEFNVWYDREHLAERVAIDGFLEARRWIAEQAQPKYFCTYSTAKFDDLSGPAYQRALANQTDWSKKNISRFKNMIRAVGRITVSRGQGRGAALAVVRLRLEPESGEALRQRMRELLDPAMLPGIISLHLVESDPRLSQSLTDRDKPNPGAGDWFVLVEGTHVDAVRAHASRFGNAGASIVATGTYRLMWDLAKADL
jgi:hypothetical protein